VLPYVRGNCGSGLSKLKNQKAAQNLHLTSSSRVIRATGKLKSHGDDIERSAKEWSFACPCWLLVATTVAESTYYSHVLATSNKPQSC